MNERLHKIDREIVEILSRYDGHLTYEHKPFVPSPENRDEMRSKIRAVARGVSEAQKEFTGKAHEALFGHWAELLELMEARLEDDKGYPYRFLRVVITKVNSLVNFGSVDIEARVRGVEEILEHAPSVLDAICDLIRYVPRAKRESVVDMLRSTVTLAQGLPTRMASAFEGISKSRLDRLSALATSMGHKAQEVLSTAHALPEPPYGRAECGLSYPDTLRLIYGIDVNELVEMHRREVEMCNRKFYEVGRMIDPARDPFAILDEDLGPYDNPDDMYKAGKSMVAFARECALEYITLPTGETCEVWETPDHLKETYPWGGYWGASTLKGELNGAVFLNKANFRAVTKGWVELNAIHECYPGHHAHAVKTAAANMPLSFKWANLTSRSSPHSEGVAHRSETLMKDIWNDAFPLFVAYRQLHTSVRIWCDLEMFHFGKGREAGVELYMRYLRFSRVSALGQVKSQELTPGYFTIYYYGMKALERLQQKYSWNDKHFTELIFSAGKTSLATVERLMGMSPDERGELLARFY